MRRYSCNKYSVCGTHYQLEKFCDGARHYEVERLDGDDTQWPFYRVIGTCDGTCGKPKEVKKDGREQEATEKTCREAGIKGCKES